MLLSVIYFNYSSLNIDIHFNDCVFHFINLFMKKKLRQKNIYFYLCFGVDYIMIRSKFYWHCFVFYINMVVMNFYIRYWNFYNEIKSFYMKINFLMVFVNEVFVWFMLVEWIYMPSQMVNIKFLTKRETCFQHLQDYYLLKII